jgi:adenosylcobinamide-GDP ribazoletransferase
MDTMDALHSYRDKEKKLEILKDPHIGAFSVSMLALYGLFYLGALSLIKGTQTIALASIVFVLSRTLSGLCAICLKSAREGTLKTFTDSSSKVLVCVILIIEAALCITGMMWINPIMAAGVSVIVLCTVLYYYLKTKKEFGGVTGDTAGYFLLITEKNALVVIGILSVLPQIIEKVMK